VQKIKFVGVVVFEKKRFEAIVDGNTYAYERPWHKGRRRNSSVLKTRRTLMFVLEVRQTILKIRLYFCCEFPEWPGGFDNISVS
jgi:hypothetical protein